MKLLMSAASPYVRSVRIMIREADLLKQVEEVEVTTSPMASAPEVIAANPLGKIPALIRPDGQGLYDSRVITRFLDDYASSDLYPKGRLWDVLTLEATAVAIMDAAVGITYEMRFRAPEIQYDDWLDAQWDKATRALENIEAQWLEKMSGPLDMGQIYVASALGYLDLRHDSRKWRNHAPSLAIWFAAFSKRDSMQQTKPD